MIEVQERSRELSQFDVADALADLLEERDTNRRYHIYWIVRTLGRTQARELLEELIETNDVVTSEMFCVHTLTFGIPKEGKTIRPYSTNGVLERPLSAYEITRIVAARIDEKEARGKSQIKHLVWRIGATQVWRIMHEALSIEKNGGMMTSDGSRRRTLGGIFFCLARQQAG